MTQQVLTVHRKRPVVIETPMGFVEIVRVSGDRLRIMVPPGLKAHRGIDRAVNGSRFVEQDEQGNVTPKYEFLVPELDSEGRLVDLKPAEPFVTEQSNG